MANYPTTQGTEFRRAIKKLFQTSYFLKKNLFLLNYNASLQTWAFEVSNRVNIIKEYWNNKLFEHF